MNIAGMIDSKGIWMDAKSTPYWYGDSVAVPVSAPNALFCIITKCSLYSLLRAPYSVVVASMRSTPT
jgi:hypothetical protein